MKPTGQMQQAGQRLWLDSISRDLLASGRLRHYVQDFSVTGLTSNPTIFDHAIEQSSDYDDDIRAGVEKGLSPEEVFFSLALDDLRSAAELFAPAHRSSGGTDGWVSLEVSPRLAHDAASTVAQAQQLHHRAGVDNLFIKIPGTEEGATAIEDSIAAGIPVNVTLLFSPEHYQRAAEAYLRGIGRRIDAGQDPAVGSVASLFVSRWDTAVSGVVGAELRDRLGIAVATKTYQRYRELLASPRWQRLAAAGAQPQKLLFASTSTKDPDAPDTLYISALAAPDTINTMPEKTLEAFADHGTVGDLLAPDGGDADEVLAQFDRAGVEVAALAAKLQSDGEQSFDASWDSLLAALDRSMARLGGTP
ncbi:MAG TPA: transaldolase [Pseudonocardiaceae bacterium]